VNNRLSFQKLSIKVEKCSWLQGEGAGLNVLDIIEEFDDSSDPERGRFVKIYSDKDGART